MAATRPATPLGGRRIQSFAGCLSTSFADARMQFDADRGYFFPVEHKATYAAHMGPDHPCPSRHPGHVPTWVQEID